jgi:hypothetical protein
MKVRTLGCAAALTVATLLAGLGEAQAQVGTYRAGTAPFNVGQAGIFITFATPLASANYSVSVQATNTGGYSPTTECTYFNVLHKTASGFDVQHKKCSDGTPLALDVGVGLDWIAIIKTDP